MPWAPATQEQEVISHQGSAEKQNQEQREREIDIFVGKRFTSGNWGLVSLKSKGHLLKLQGQAELIES